MTTPFYYLAGLLLLTTYPWGKEPLMFAREPLVAPWAALGSIAVYAVICWGVLAARPRHVGLARELLRGLAVVLFALLVFIFHFPLWIWSIGVEQDPLAVTLLGLAPLVALNGTFTLINSRLNPQSGSLSFALRIFLGLSGLPILFMLLLAEAFDRVGPLMRMAFVYPILGWVFVLGSLLFAMTLLPLLLRFVLGARPMVPGPLRDRLERTAAAAGYEGACLYVVPTGSARMANAFVAGLTFRWRYVFLMDGIVAGMSPEQLDCVVAHEVTHATKKHLLYFLIAGLALSAISGLLHEGLGAAGVPTFFLEPLLLSGSAAYWVLGFGFVSRRFETEADLVAARLVPAGEGGLPPYAAARKMADALYRVADLNNVPLDARTWRHFNLAKRIEILLKAELNPAVGIRIELICERIRSTALTLILGALACASVLFLLQRGKAAENWKLLNAYDQVERGRQELAAGNYRSALDFLKKGLEGGSNRVEAWLWRADAERALDLPESAKESEAKARELGITDPRLRLRVPP